jgi:hypothetical protein
MNSFLKETIEDCTDPVATAPGSDFVYRLSRIKIPATMPRTASPVVTAVDTRTLSNGNSPVRINHKPSKSIPKFRPAKPFVTAISFSFLKCDHLSLKRPCECFQFCSQLKTLIVNVARILSELVRSSQINDAEWCVDFRSAEAITEPSAVAPDVGVYSINICKHPSLLIKELLLASGTTALASVSPGLTTHLRFAPPLRFPVFPFTIYQSWLNGLSNLDIPPPVSPRGT